MVKTIEQVLKEQELAKIQPQQGVVSQGQMPTTSQMVNSTNTGVKIANPNGQNQYTGGIQPETSIAGWLSRGPGSLANLTPQEKQSFYTQEEKNLGLKDGVAFNALPQKQLYDLFQPTTFPTQSEMDMQKNIQEANKAWRQGDFGGYLWNTLQATGNRIFSPFDTFTTNIAEKIAPTVPNFTGLNLGFGVDKPKQSPLAKAVEAIPQINPFYNVQQPKQAPLQMPNLNSAEQEYLRQLQGLQQKPEQFQPTQVNFGRPEFNQQNLQQNIQNAFNTPGTKMDTNTYNQLLSKFMAGTQERLYQSDIEKKAIEDKIAKLSGEAKNEITDAWKNQDFGTAIMNIALAGGKNKQAAKLQEALNKMTASDRTAAQTELMRLQEQIAGTEKERAAFDAGFAQRLAQTGLSAQNQAELNKQAFDQKMKELGIGIQLSDIKDKRQTDKEVSAYNRELAKLAILTPEQRLANQLATAKTGLIDAALTSLNPNATPQQKKQAEFNAKIYNIPIQALSPQKEQELKPVVVDGEIVNIDTKTGRAVGRILSTEQKAKIMAERDAEVEAILNNKNLTREKQKAEIDKINEKYRF